MNRLFFILLLCGCAAETAPKDSPPKTLNASWVSDGAPAWTANLGTVSPNVASTMTWVYMKGLGGTCQSDVILTPLTANAGSFTASNSIALSVVAGDPPCSMFDQTWTYSLSGGVLSLCGSLEVSCVEFN